MMSQVGGVIGYAPLHRRIFKAYENPRFVEDVVREVAKKLKKDPNITWFTVESENFESIHNHSAYAFVERNREE